MCFRPDSAGGGGPMKCPGCGKPIQMMAGITLDKCPFCKEDFTPLRRPPALLAPRRLLVPRRLLARNFRKEVLDALIRGGRRKPFRKIGGLLVT